MKAVLRQDNTIWITSTNKKEAARLEEIINDGMCCGFEVASAVTASKPGESAVQAEFIIEVRNTPLPEKVN